MINLASRAVSRRSFFNFAGAATAVGGAGLLTGFPQLAAAQRSTLSPKIKSVQAMTLQGPRTYTFVKTTADDGTYGIGEAYGAPDVGVKEQIEAIGPTLVGKNPLEIEVLFAYLGKGAPALSGTRTDGSAHNLIYAASGIEMSLWDLAGKILGVHTTTLLGGRFRDTVRVTHNSGPRNMLDKDQCREWAAKVKADPCGFTGHKMAPQHTTHATDNARDPSGRQFTTKELIQIAQGFENVREAIGWDHDIMVHCSWEYDVRTSIELAQAVAPIKPLWLEDPLAINYYDGWKQLTEVSEVPILMGENLSRVEGFFPFITNRGCDIVHPDLRNAGGMLETKRIADLAKLYGMPMANHNSGSQLNTWAVCQWAGSIQDYLVCETHTGLGDWMDQVLLLDGPYIKDGHIRVTDKPGIGVDLNPDVVKAHLAQGEKWWG